MSVEVQSLREPLTAGAHMLSLHISEKQIGKLMAYVALLAKWNAVYNLTAVRDPQHMLTQHLLDCMAALPAYSGARRVLDVGSGGGLPGIVLAIWAQQAEPGMTVHMIDTVHKKTAFLTQVKAELDLHNARIHTGRVEHLHVDTPFEVITSRAFAELKDFVNGSGHLLAAGGKINNLEPGKKLLLECKKAGMRIYPTNEAFAQGLKQDEFGIGVMWKARVVQWQNAGIKVQTVAPKEGVPMYVSGFVMPKNAPNKEGAYAWLDAMMAASAQENFAIDMGYNPTVTNAKVADDLQKRIGFTPEEQKRLVDLDYGYMGKNDVDFQDWWNKSFKG